MEDPGYSGVQRGDVGVKLSAIAVTLPEPPSFAFDHLSCSPHLRSFQNSTVVKTGNGISIISSGIPLIGYSSSNRSPTLLIFDDQNVNLFWFILGIVSSRCTSH